MRWRDVKQQTSSHIYSAAERILPKDEIPFYNIYLCNTYVERVRCNSYAEIEFQVSASFRS